MTKSFMSCYFWILLIGLALAAGCCPAEDDGPHGRDDDDSTPGRYSEAESEAEEALRDALHALLQAERAMDEDDDEEEAIAELRQAVKSLDAARRAPPCESHGKDCCKVFTPKGCPPEKSCQVDACVTIQMTPLGRQDANFTSNGTNSFMNIFGAAVARGAENATIRAMNATKVCPNPPCDPQKVQAAAEEDSD